MNGPSVLLIEDHALVRTGLRTSLAATGFSVVGEAEDGVAGLALAREVQPEIVVLDLGIPGKDGLAVARELRGESSAPRILVLSMKDDERAILAAIRAGAHGYCVKSEPPETIVDAIRALARGGSYFDRNAGPIALEALCANRAVAAHSPLTARETEILMLVADGVGNGEIAERLFLSLGTVKTHVAEIMRTLAAADRAHATAIALRNGYIA